MGDSLAFPLQISLLSSQTDNGRYDGKCIHEEGGKNAIYQEVDEKQLTKIRHNIHMGTSYIVVSCKCVSDRSLKSIDQWCSFCKCPICGDNKNLFTKNQSNKAWQYRQERYRKLVHLIPGI